MAPKNIGTCRMSPLVSFDLSSSVSAGSDAANCTVPLCSAATPAPEPTPWKFSVMLWDLSSLPHS